MDVGVGFLILAMFLTPAVDGFAKALSAEHTPMMIAFLRYLAAGLIALALARTTGRRIAIPPGDRLGQALRTALLMGAMTSLIAALGMVPMAKAVGGFLIAPIVSSLLGVVVWGERLTATRLAGSALAVTGAVVLMRPEAGIEAGGLCAPLGGALLGTYLSATRGATICTDPLSTLAVQGVLGAALIAPFALARGLPAISADLVLSALALGGISAVCHLLTVAAYQRAEATVLTPFLYFNLITAVAAGYFWFGETPTPSSLLGLGAIAAGGLITVSRRDAPRFGSVGVTGAAFRVLLPRLIVR